MKYLNFQEEKDIILQSLINDIFGKVYSTENKDSLEQEISLELYITPECNQNCSYCYLCKYGEELYPSKLRDQK